MHHNKIDEEQAIKLLRHFRQVKRPKRFHLSVLYPYTAEIIYLKTNGISFSEIAWFLEEFYGVRVSRSTVCRYFNKVWGEPQEKGM